MMSTVNARNMQRSLINVLYVNKQEFGASSWRSSQGYTKMHGQPTDITQNSLYTGHNGIMSHF